jgi:hypothetical protein
MHLLLVLLAASHILAAPNAHLHARAAHPDPVPAPAPHAVVEGLAVWEGFGELGRYGLNLVKRSLHERATPPATPKSYYTALVAVGASYTGASTSLESYGDDSEAWLTCSLRADNGHSRAAEYIGSLRQYYPYSSYGGRYSNGPVAAEYMVSGATKPVLPKGTKAIKLLNCAFSPGVSHLEGALVRTTQSPDNLFTAHRRLRRIRHPERTRWDPIEPAWCQGPGELSSARARSRTRTTHAHRLVSSSPTQIVQYLADLKAGTADIGDGRVLHYFNSGSSRSPFRAFAGNVH